MTNDRTTKKYGTHHRRLRATYVARLARGEVIPCCRCSKPISGKGAPFDLDHDPDDDTGLQYLGIAHRSCNRSNRTPKERNLPRVDVIEGPGRGRPTAEERIRRDQAANPNGGHVVDSRPGRGSIREMEGEGAPTPIASHMAGPHRKDGKNLSQYWPGHCDCRPGEVERDAAYRAYLTESTRRGRIAVEIGTQAALDDHYRWLDENEPYARARRNAA